MPTAGDYYRYDDFCRRARAAGYDGDIADLLAEEHERERDRRRAERERAKGNQRQEEAS